MRICSLRGCDEPLHAKRPQHGYCTLHYNRWRRHGDPGEAKTRRLSALGLCTVDGCERPVLAKRLCNVHYHRKRLHGDPLADKPIQSKTTKGNRNAHGYHLTYIPDHPNADSCGHVPTHRLVMSEALGRPLLPDETVHHKNGIRNDNRLENLELWVSRHPKGQRVEDLLPWARELVTRYEGRLFV